jgi:hypothetical protein
LRSRYLIEDLYMFNVLTTVPLFFFSVHLYLIFLSQEANHAPAILRGGGQHGGGRRRRLPRANIFVENPLESALRKLGKGIFDHQLQQQKNEKDKHHFARRQLLVSAESQRKLVDRNMMDSMKSVVFHLTAAQQQTADKDDMSVVVMHLKTAIAEMNTVMNNNQHGRRRRELELLEMAGTATTTFRESVMGLAQAALLDNQQAFFRHKSDTQTSIQTALGELHAALEQHVSSEQEMQDFGRQLIETRNEYNANNNNNNNNSNLQHDLVATATVVTSALEHFLDATTTAATTSSTQQLELAKDLLGLLWIMPVSVVTGTFFWAFAGIWEYRGEFTLFQIWLLEILWVMVRATLLFQIVAFLTFNPVWTTEHPFFFSLDFITFFRTLLLAPLTTKVCA